MPTYELVSHHLCPYVQRAAIVLLEKSVPFKRTLIDLANKPDWFKAISPLGKVPLLKVTLDDGETVVLFESAVICEYLEETLPNPLHPADPLLRAQHRGWMEFGSAILADIWGYETAKDEAAALAKAAALKLKFERLERALGEGPFFAGERFAVVDAVFGPVFRYFDVFDALVDHGIFAACPEVRAWRAALAARPSVRAAVDADYPERLRDFLDKREAWIGRSIATNDGIQPKKSYIASAAHN
jgi:glutathione S-transferase